MLDLIGLVLEVIATIVVETVVWFAKVLFWPSRRSETPDASATARELKALPSDTTLRIVAALTAGDDATAVLPTGWRSFHSSIVDAPSPKAGDTVPVGAELLVVPRPDPVGEMASYAVVAPLHGSTVPLGTLTNQEFDRSIALGRVRCWLAASRRSSVRPQPSSSSPSTIPESGGPGCNSWNSPTNSSAGSSCCSRSCWRPCSARRMAAGAPAPTSCLRSRACQRTRSSSS